MLKYPYIIVDKSQYFNKMGVLVVNNHDAVMAAIEFKKPDNLPAWDDYWGAFSQKWRNYMGIKDNVDPGDYYGMAVSIQLGDETFFPSAKMVIESNGDFDLLNDGWGRIVKDSFGVQ